MAAVDETRKQAFLNGDCKALEALHAPNAVLVGSSGAFHGTVEIRRSIARIVQIIDVAPGCDNVRRIN